MLNHVLVLGDDVRSFLSIVKSLGEKGLIIDCCSEDHTSHALRSRYLNKKYSLPPYDLNVSKWVSSLKDLLLNNRYSLIIPCNDRSIIPIMENFIEFKDFPIALPNQKAYRYFYDKHETRMLARKMGVPVSQGRLLSENDTTKSLIKEFGLPVIIKPRRSYALNKIAFRNKVFKIKTPKVLASILNQIKKNDEYLVEKFFTGVGAGISILADDGKILAAFQHLRVNEPPDGGGSSYRKSVPINRKMLRLVEKLAIETSLTGVSMFEFKVNPETQECILVEVNARFWGSLPLAIGAGIDFPFLLYKRFVLKQRVMIRDYTIDYFGRNFIADIYCQISHYESIEFKSPREKFFFISNYVKGYLRIFTKKEAIDTFSLKDPMPGLSELYEFVQGVLGKITNKYTPFHKITRMMKKNKTIKELKKHSNVPVSIAFICSGNICRSPFAEFYFRKLIKNKEDDFKIGSYGLLPLEDRSCPDNAILSGTKFDIDLNKHRSKFASDDVLKKNQLIVIFDHNNETNIKARGLDELGTIVNLANIIGFDEISDPYGGDEDAFYSKYQMIAKSLENMLKILMAAAKD